MPRVNQPRTIDQATMAKLVEQPPEPPESVSEEMEESNEEKIVVVKIPSRYTEDKVKTLMESMVNQFSDSGYRPIFAPNEVDVYLLGQTPPPNDPRRW
jgi:hypothetical protein